MFMRIFYLFFGGMFLFLTSCIKDEPLNMEADIVSVIASEDIFLLDPVISNSSVTLYLKPDQEDVKNLKIDFKLTPGASIVLSAEDFSMPEGEIDTSEVIISQMQKDGVKYKVTAQDGKHAKKYLIKIVNTKGGFVPVQYGFEEFEVEAENKYTVFYNLVDGQKFYNWASGNPSFYLTLMLGGGVIEPGAYPTMVTDEAFSGKKATLLETKGTGSFGAAFKKPIAAGNLFVGTFDSGPVLTDPLSATRFGLPFNKIPVALEGVYKYQVGPKVTDMNLKELDQKDECDIYAVFYNRKQLMESEKDPKKKKSYLTGHNIFTDPSVVAVARLENGDPTKGDGFSKFSIPFKYTKEVQQADVDGLDYSIAIVMTSSKYGDNFIGAVGSKLIVDEIKIVTR